jgi:Ferritin-like domain
MDYSRDELRRQARASQDEHRAVMGRWRSALGQLFDPASDATGSDRAAFLGVPSRRQFLRIGGLTIAGSALLVACGDDDNDATGNTTTTAAGGAGTTSTTAGNTTTTGMAANETDLTLLRTASSIEVLAVNTYQAAIDSGLVTDEAIASAATLFQSQHADHGAALQAQTTDLGGEAYTDPNPFLQENVVDPALTAVTDQLSVVRLALDLEDAAAQTYALAGGVLSTPTLRQIIMSIGGVESRHLAVLRGVVDGAGVAQTPDGFLSTEGAAPEESYV